MTRDERDMKKPSTKDLVTTDASVELTIYKI